MHTPYSLRVLTILQKYVAKDPVNMLNLYKVNFDHQVPLMGRIGNRKNDRAVPPLYTGSISRYPLVFDWEGEKINDPLARRPACLDFVSSSGE